MSGRSHLSRRVRFEVFKRDGFTCQYCGSHPPDVVLEIDHIEPVAEGGSDDEENLFTACMDCNRGKSSIPLSVAPKSLGERGDEISEQEAQLAGYRQALQIRLDRIEQDKWAVAEALCPGSGKDGMRRDWLQSIKMFNTRLEVHEVIEAAKIALARMPYADRGRDARRFKYFCGVCWQMVRNREGVQ